MAQGLGCSCGWRQPGSILPFTTNQCGRLAEWIGVLRPRSGSACTFLGGFSDNPTRQSLRPKFLGHLPDGLSQREYARRDAEVRLSFLQPCSSISAGLWSRKLSIAPRAACRLTTSFRAMQLPLLPEAQAGIPIVRATLDSPSTPVRVLFTEDLSRMLGKSVTTIRTFATSSKYSHLIPRPFKMPGSRRLCWYERDVLAWIESTKPAEPPPPRRPRGRPTKAEQIARQRWAATTFTQSNT